MASEPSLLDEFEDNLFEEDSEELEPDTGHDDDDAHDSVDFGVSPKDVQQPRQQISLKKSLSISQPPQMTGKPLLKRTMSMIGKATFQMEQSDPRWVSTIHGIVTLAGAVPPRDLIEKRMTERLLCFERFRSRVKEENGKYFWEEVPHVDLRKHLIFRDVPTPHDQAAVNAYVEALLVKPLDPSRPLWEFHFLSGFGPTRSDSVWVSRIHHAIADGTTLVYVMFSVMDSAAAQAVPLPASSASTKPPPQASAAAPAPPAAAPTEDDARSHASAAPSPSACCCGYCTRWHPCTSARTSSLRTCCWPCSCPACLATRPTQ